ncbi:16538_t:CDS:2 [Acaulospora morrowiae]|uniref:16538_t:CDS:1 n=1 Tax=Acaulospora morrowiae TaxID=94023 RepID=A0A9N9EK99_9GLOM|nr:16538_t:CDS:2 [Acaulospora morrowiae]
MPDPPINSNNPPPPAARTSTQNLIAFLAYLSFIYQAEEEEDFESMQFSSEAIDVATKFQRLLDAYKRYKRQNELLEKEKTDLLTQNYNIRLQADQWQKAVNDITVRMDSEKRRYQQRANESDLEIQGLKKQIVQFKDEASQLQSRLGNATSFHWGDNDANNTVQLNKVISNIQDKLDEFAMVKGRDVLIIEENAARLLQQYKCTTKIGGGKGKPVLSAALQRLTLETLFHHLNKYLHQPEKSSRQNPQLVNQQLQQQHQQALATSRHSTSPQPNPRSSSLGAEQNNNLEVEITTTMTSLCDLVSQLTESRQGSDDVSRATPIKIRQQIYAVLGTRGFCKDGHPFIEQLSSAILEKIGQYRQLKSEERQSEVKKNTIEIVRDIVQLYFRLNAQEPVPDFTEFFGAGSTIQNNVMDGSWDDDNIEDLEVEICSFPLISVRGKDNVRKVLSKAQVVARKRN